MQESYNKINPIYTNLTNTLMRLLFNPIEIQKENLNLQSYIFAPNHTNNLDRYLIWSLLSKKFELDTFMFKEFWNNFPKIAKYLQPLHIFPITRDKVQLSEIKTELKRLKDNNHSLLIFPDGRHVDPKLMLEFTDYHEKTIPLGAFYIAALSNKPLLPIFLEPQIPFHQNAIVYAKPLIPKDFDLYPNKKIDKRNLIELCKAWLNAINEAHKKVETHLNRSIHPYHVQQNYTDSTGENYGNQEDPNAIINYLSEIKLLMEQGYKLSENSLEEIAEKSHIPKDSLNKILTIKKQYEKNLQRR